MTRAPAAGQTTLDSEAVSSPYADENFFRALLTKAVAGKASDVHIKVGQPPGARIRGEMVYFRTEKIAAEDAEAVARHVIRKPEPARAPRRAQGVRHVVLSRPASGGSA